MPNSLFAKGLPLWKTTSPLLYIFTSKSRKNNCWSTELLKVRKRAYRGYLSQILAKDRSAMQIIEFTWLRMHHLAIHNNGFYFRNWLRHALILSVNAYCITVKRMPACNGVFKRSFFVPPPLLQKEIMWLKLRCDCTANTKACRFIISALHFPVRVQQTWIHT